MIRPTRAVLAGVALAVAAFLLHPGGAKAQDGERALPAVRRLSLDEAIGLARRNNPSFQAVRNDEHAADWRVRSAYGALLPSASVSSTLSWQGSGEQRFGGTLTSGDVGLGRQPSFLLSSYSAGLSHELTWGKVKEPGRAKADRKATRARIASAENDLTLQVTREYLALLRAREALELAAQRLERARQNLRLAEARREVGDVTALDARQAEVTVGRAEVALVRARNEMETAELRLVRRLGVEVADSIVPTTEPEVFEPGWDREALVARAMGSNPGLRALRAGESAAGYGVAIARSAYYPSVFLRAGLSGFTREATETGLLVDRALDQAESNAVSRRNQCEALNEIFRRLADPLPTQDCGEFSLTDEERSEIRSAVRASNDAFPFDFTDLPPELSLTVSIPVFQGLSRQRQLEEAQVARDDARYQRREEELRLRAEIGAALGSVRSAYEAVTLEERNRAVAEEQLRLARERYRLGGVSFIDLVEAETLRAEADQAYLNATYTFHEAVAGLEALVGQSLRKGTRP